MNAAYWLAYDEKTEDTIEGAWNAAYRWIRRGPGPCLRRTRRWGRLRQEVAMLALVTVEGPQGRVIATTLGEARRARALTARQLGEAVGLGESMILEVEAGRRKLKPARQEAMAGVLGVTVAEVRQLLGACGECGR